MRFPKNVPDYWWGLHEDRSPRVTLHKGLHLDETTLAGHGKRSIRLEPDMICRATLWHSLRAGTRYRFRVKMRRSAKVPRCNPAFVWYIDGRAVSRGIVGRQSNAPVGTWEPFETTFVAPAEGGALYLYSGKDATVWFDDFNVVPLTAPGEATGE